MAAGSHDTTGRAGRIEDLFDAARKLGRAERADFLQRECGDDDDLRREVDSLLEQVEADPDFLESSAADERPDLARRLGGVERIGAYRLIRMLGEGGMGVVFLAEQESPRREVAVKIVHPAFVSPGAVARLAREGDALGRLQHPAIARVIEVGEAEGPYEMPITFVAMELVDGGPITDEADARGLDLRDRLELVVQVADAVQHAHERSVVHRDLKPSNVLLTEEGRPQVLDFGIARILDDPADTLTATGHAVGTPAYMAPEQVRGGAAAASVKVDVYALGGLAYELVTGRPPLVLDGRTPAELLLAIAREEPPPLARLNPDVDRDLATVVHKAMAHVPEERYASAAEFADDLRRYLRDEPIQARRPSLVYRAVKLMRRHRTVSAAALLVLIVASIAVLLVAGSRRERLVRVDQVRSLLTMIETVLLDSDPFEGGSLTSEQVASLSESEQWIEEDLGRHHPELGGELLATLSRIHRNRGDFAHAESVAERAVEVSELGGNPLDVARARSALGLAVAYQDRPAEAEPLFRESLEWFRAAGDSYVAEALSSQHNLAMSLKDQGFFEPAEELYRDCFEKRKELFGPDDPATAATRSSLARLLQDSGADLPGAVELLRESVASSERTIGVDEPKTLVYSSQLAGALTAAGQPREALEILAVIDPRFVELLGADHPDTLAARRNAVNAYLASGDVFAARELLERMLPDARARFGVVDRRSLELLSRLAQSCSLMGDWPVATETWGEAEEVALELYGGAHPEAVGSSLRRLETLDLAGRSDEADELFPDLVERAEALPVGHPIRLQVEALAANR